MPQSGHASIIRAERGSPYPGTGQNLGLDKEAGKMSVRQTAPANEHLTSPRLTVKDLPKIVLRLLAGAVLIFGLISLIGLVLTHVLNTGPFHRADLSADVWFADHRTKLWNQITRVGTDLARTETVIIATAVLALVLRLWLKRWHESVVLVITIAGELLIFLTVTVVVPQRRPPVIRLDPAPPTSSYPSGHTAASVALYGCLAVILVWVYGRQPLARFAAGLLWCVPVFVGFSRVYRGMHYPSDVLAGALLSGLWLSLVVRTLLPWGHRTHPGRRNPAEPNGVQAPRPPIPDPPASPP
jgi:membrane-associated phospholipid phosphatase